MRSHDAPWHEEILDEAVEHVLKSLTYFEEAEREPMPDMLVPLAWDEVKQFFCREVPLFLGLFKGESGA